MTRGFAFCALRLCLFSIHLCGSHADQRRLIVNGQEAEVGQFPYTALLGFYNEVTKQLYPVCGCTLLDTTHAVTAAHCVDSITNGWRFMVVAGLHSLSNFREEIERADKPARPTLVKRVQLHESYNPDRKSFYYWGSLTGTLRELKDFAYDVAVLEFVDPTGWEGIPAIGGLDKASTAPATAIGWGFVGNNQASMSDTPRYVEMNLVPSVPCIQAYWDANADVYSGHPTHLCAGGVSGEGVCNGDSGGSLIVTRNDSTPMLIGIPSFSLSPPPNCGSIFSEPAVFARVSELAPWICERAPEAPACVVVSDEDVQEDEFVEEGGLYFRDMRWSTVHNLIQINGASMVSVSKSMGTLLHGTLQFYPHQDWRQILSPSTVLMVEEKTPSIWTHWEDEDRAVWLFRRVKNYLLIQGEVTSRDVQTGAYHAILGCANSQAPASSREVVQLMRNRYERSNHHMPWLYKTNETLPTLPDTVAFELDEHRFGDGVRPGQLRTATTTTSQQSTDWIRTHENYWSSRITGPSHHMHMSVHPTAPTANASKNRILSTDPHTSSPSLDLAPDPATWTALVLRDVDQQHSDVAVAWYVNANLVVSGPYILGGKLMVEGYDVQQFCNIPSMTADELRNVGS